MVANVGPQSEQDQGHVVSRVQALLDVAKAHPAGGRYHSERAGSAATARAAAGAAAAPAPVAHAVGVPLWHAHGAELFVRLQLLVNEMREEGVIGYLASVRIEGMITSRDERLRRAYLRAVGVATECPPGTLGDEVEFTFVERLKDEFQQL